MNGGAGQAVDLAAPRRTSPAAALFVLLKLRLGTAAIVLIPVVLRGRAAGIAVGVVVLLVVGLARWWARQWSYDGAVLTLREGVLVRHDRRLPVERIQHVQLDRHLRHLLLGLAVVRVEAAGAAAGAEIELDAIRLTDAEALRDGIQAALRARATSQPRLDELDPERSPVAVRWPGQPEPPPVVSLSWRRLLLAGITGPEVLAVLAALGAAQASLDDFGFDIRSVDAPDATVPVLVAAGVFVVVAWFGVAAVLSVVRHWRLRVLLVGQDSSETPFDSGSSSPAAGATDLPQGLPPQEMVVRYGLLRQTELTIRLHRVQIVRLHASVLRRGLGHADLHLRTAGGGSGDDDRSSVRIPMLRPAEIDRVLAAVLPGTVPRPVLAPIPTRARPRIYVRNLLVAAAVVGVVAAVTWSGGPTRAGLLSLILLPLAAVRAEAACRTLGVALDGGYLTSRVGAVARSTSIAPLARVQSGSTRQSPFQRMRRLASAGVDLPGRRVWVPHRDQDEAASLVSRSLSQLRVEPKTGDGPAVAGPSIT